MQLTVDNSWVEEVVKAGHVSREEASEDRRADWVTQILGMKHDKVTIHAASTALSPGDIVLLCTDGLWNYFHKTGELSNKVAEIKMRHGATVTAYQVCDALVAEANARVGNDNIAVPLFQN
ncbi:MAG: SpoIIE family protein phosphatase [Desulfocapsaceae bacterium]|nr:SpoIIE family protein phosphatase [Desulfocapsaceae bacterium]